MDQPKPTPTPAPTAAAEVVPASTGACTAAQQGIGSVDAGGGEAEGINSASNATGDEPKAEGRSSVDNDHDGDTDNGVLGTETAGDAANAADADGGQAHERKKRPPRVGSVRQGRKDKRKAEWKAKKARMKETKLLERQQREEAARKEGRELPAAGANYRDLPREQWSVSQKINHAKRVEFEEKSTQGGYRVCIDMAFDDLMLEKAQASVGQQVMYAYSANRKAIQPCRITLSGLGEVMRAQVGKLTGFDTWLGVATDSRCYTEIFDKEELVYLTADSPDTITQLEKGKVYILGGLVDRNAHKGLCFKKAMDQGIATAKLPLKRGDLNGAHTKVLATNHVFDILVQAMGAGGNLEKIEEKTLPPRKRAGWTGGDDRGPSSKPAATKRADADADQQLPGGDGSLDPSSVGESDEEAPKGCDGAGGGTAASSSRDIHGPSEGLSAASAEKTGQQKRGSEITDPGTSNSDDRGRDAEGGPAGEIGGKGEGEGVTQADVADAGARGEPVVVKRAVEEGGDVGSSAGVDAACKRGRTETDGADVA